MKYINYLFGLIGLFLLTETHGQNLSTTGGTQIGNTIKFTINDYAIVQGFKITADIKLNPSWWNTEKKIIEIKQYKADNSIISFYINNGTFIIERPVKYGNDIKLFKLDSWNKNMISKGQYDSQTTMTFEIGFSEGSYKIYIWESNATIQTGVCEYGFWGLGSGDNGLREKLPKDFFGTTYDIQFWRTNSDGFQSGLYNGNHNRNYKSCFTLNQRHLGIPSLNMADPLSGVTSDGKRNCQGTNQSQALKVDLGDFVDAEVQKDLILTDLEEISIYPVPANNYLIIELPQHWQQRKIELQLVDLSGRAYISDYNFISYQEMEVDVSSIPTGVYILSVSNGESIERKKVIIE